MIVSYIWVLGTSTIQGMHPGLDDAKLNWVDIVEGS